MSHIANKPRADSSARQLELRLGRCARRKLPAEAKSRRRLHMAERAGIPTAPRRLLAPLHRAGEPTEMPNTKDRRFAFAYDPDCSLGLHCQVRMEEKSDLDWNRRDGAHNGEPQ